MELELTNEINKDMDLSKEKYEFEKIISNILDKTSNYIIKSLPIQENIKDVIIDVKEVVKTKDMKKILSTAMNSALREGMELLGLSKDKIQDVMNFKDIIFKGGIRENLCASLETVYSKYTKNNLFSEDIENFVERLKNNINSKDFKEKIDEKINVIRADQDRISELFNKWYEAYENLELSKINNISECINKLKGTTLTTELQDRGIKIINNMTSLINSKNSKLTEMEVNLCNNI